MLCSVLTHWKIGCADPTGCQKVFHSFSLAVELGSARIRGNDLSSGIAEVNGGNTREKEREREKKMETDG